MYLKKKLIKQMSKNIMLSRVIFMISVNIYRKNIISYIYLKRHGDVQTDNLPNIESLHKFHIFMYRIKRLTIEILRCSKLNKPNYKEKNRVFCRVNTYILSFPSVPLPACKRNRMLILQRGIYHAASK